ncbi:wsc domain containing protein [Colletotrichum sojae]|uniref:Wsc domain containing protein n=1 Tax=Colletotrichum sojae TaxID=2175907 RepID=A0A8H6MQH3_9PEZI|nr:wsc domain containing protein [Colletotrichum sojae]
MKLDSSSLLGLLGLAAHALADPTWPSDIDELEEIMYQTGQLRSRKFADTVNPCTREVSGPGRRNAAEWLRTAFHDMSTANIYQGFGGLDASLQYELGSSENAGPGFGTTMTFMSPYLTRKSSMSDLIALGVYTSVLSCGGPSVAIRSGRVDATKAGNPGVPQPQNDIGLFKNQFLRLGFSTEEMIQVTACGHTIGGVHSAQNSDIVPVGRFPDEVATFDTTDAAFDNKIVTEYLDGSTKNPLVFVPGTATRKNSDFKVFVADGNVTMNSLANPTTFNSACKTVFEKMINVVPPGVTLGDPIKPYEVKPVQLQLTLTNVAMMQLTGYIRVRTTQYTAGTIADIIADITINYKNRNGGTTCGSGNCAFNIPLQGISKGLEDTFAWFPLGQDLPVSSGISSFTITINMKNGPSQFYDNNGNGYPVQDGIFLQTTQSCLNQNSGQTTIIAAVRNDRTTLPVSAEITYKTKQTGTSVVPLLNKMTLDMTKGDCRGSYTFYSVTTNIPGSLSVESTIDVISGTGNSAMVDSFKKANILGGGCSSWAGGSTCSSVTVSSVVPSRTSTSVAPTATLHHRDTMGGYKLVSCWTEGANVRALTGAQFAYDGMTLDSCMANCTGFDYWGTEYGRECYCGNSLAPSSTSAPLSECNLPCSGDSTQFCGAGNRIELYSTTVTRTTSSTPAPTATLAHIPTIGKFSLVGCQTEGTNVRALQGAQTASDSMTLEKCAAFCSGWTYFGTEYAGECYCGNSLHETSKPAPIGECNMKCSGNPYQYCGDGNRLELYKAASSSSTLVTSTVAATTTSAISISASSPVPSSSTPSPTSSFSALENGSSSASSAASVTPSPTSSGGSSTPSSSSHVSTDNHAASASSTTAASSIVVSSASSDHSASSSAISSSSSANDHAVSTTSAASSTTTSSATSTAPTLAHKPTVAAYNLTGCWAEGNGIRALGQKGYASPNNMTLENCASFCSDYKYFGTEYSSECYCGNFLASSSSEAPLGDCSMTCSGNQYEYCGGGNRLTLYESNKKVTAPSQPSTVGAYTYLGCRTEPATGGRALDAKGTASDKMTNEVCAQFCDGFAYFGTEYSGECYCGNALPQTSLEAPQGDCNMLCSGNSTEYCGSGNRLSVYKK